MEKNNEQIIFIFGYIWIQPQHTISSTSNSEQVGKAMQSHFKRFSGQATCLSPPAFCLVHMHEAIGFLGLDCEDVKEKSIGHDAK